MTLKDSVMESLGVKNTYKFLPDGWRITNLDQEYDSDGNAEIRLIIYNEGLKKSLSIIIDFQSNEISIHLCTLNSDIGAYDMTLPLSVNTPIYEMNLKELIEKAISKSNEILEGTF